MGQVRARFHEIAVQRGFEEPRSGPEPQTDEAESDEAKEGAPKAPTQEDEAKEDDGFRTHKTKTKRSAFDQVP